MSVSVRTQYVLFFSIVCVMVGFFVSGLFPWASQAEHVEQVGEHQSPKTANYFLRTPIFDWEVDKLAQYDLLVVSPQTIDNSQAQLKAIRKSHPDIVILVYIPSEEFPLTYYKEWEQPGGVWHRMLNGITEDMWLYRADGSHARFWLDNWMLNPDSQWADYVSSFIADEFFTASSLYDGVFFDNVWVDPLWTGQSFDFNRDGIGDSDASVGTTWRRGMERLLTLTKQKIGSHKIILGNGRGGYTGQTNGLYLENFREGGSQQWGYWMNLLKTIADNHADPVIPIVGNNTLNRADFENYKNVRFGIGSALLEDAYHGFDLGDQAHDSILWYDEYDVSLGEPIGEATSLRGYTAYQPDVWRRDFSHGVTLVNSTNERQTIALGGEYEKLTGTQDRTVNDGAIVSEISLNGLDAILLLKTFEGLQNVVYTNGAFARFFHGDGSRVRNGFFVFDDRYPGSAEIASMDLDSNGKPELIIARGNKLEVFRDDGQLYTRQYPYTANYTGQLRVAIGDLNEDGLSELYIAPEGGYALPIKVLTRHGRQVKRDWYPFGTDYDGGYTLAVQNIAGRQNNQLVIGTGEGKLPIVHIFDRNYDFVTAWFAYETSATGGVHVATGDLDGNGTDEIITGPGPGTTPRVRMFTATGEQVNKEFLAYQSFGFPGVDVRTIDADFDGKDEIVTLSEGF